MTALADDFSQVRNIDSTAMLFSGDRLGEQCDESPTPDYLTTAADEELAAFNDVNQFSESWTPVLPSSVRASPTSDRVARKSSLSFSDSSVNESMERSKEVSSSSPSLDQSNYDIGDTVCDQISALLNGSGETPELVEVEATPGIPLPPPAPPLPVETSKCLFATETMVPRPRTSTKRLQWAKIPASRVVNVGQPTVWTVVGKILNEKVAGADQEGRSGPDFECLEQLFSLQAAASSNSLNGTASAYLHRQSPTGGASANRDATTSLDRRRKPDEITVLGSTSIMRVSIFLRQFGIHTSSNYVDVVTWLRQGSSELFGAERLRNLSTLLPDADELKLLLPYVNSDDRTRLGIPERFYLELMSVSHYELLIKSLLLKEEFQTIVDSLRPAIDSIIVTARGIKTNSALHNILATVLMAGNFLNSGAYAGEAVGFKLNSLLKLTEIRANKPHMNLMHFVAKEAVKNNEKVVEQLNELKYLNEASQYSIDTLHEDIRSLEDRVNHATEHMHLTDDHFQQKIRQFLQMAKAKIETLNSDIREMEDLRVELAAYFCEDEKTFRLDECLSVFNSFCQKFLKALEENRERSLLDEQIEQRKRQREEQLALRKFRLGRHNFSISSSCDDLASSSCTSSTSIVGESGNQSPVAFTSSSIFNSSKLNNFRRQSTPTGLVTIRYDDANLDDYEVTKDRSCRRGLSMPFADSTESVGDITSAEDLVDVLLKDSMSLTGSGNFLRPLGSPVICGSGSPMLRRRKRIVDTRLVEPLSTGRERTPSPRFSASFYNDAAVDGSPESVYSSKMATKLVGAGQDEIRVRLSRSPVDKSPTGCREAKSDRL